MGDLVYTKYSIEVLLPVVQDNLMAVAGVVHRNVARVQEIVVLRVALPVEFDCQFSKGASILHCNFLLLTKRWMME